jgi:hypothetical protein
MGVHGTYIKIDYLNAPDLHEVVDYSEKIKG